MGVSLVKTSKCQRLIYEQQYLLHLNGLKKCKFLRGNHGEHAVKWFSAKDVQ